MSYTTFLVVSFKSCSPSTYCRLQTVNERVTMAFGPTTHEIFRLSINFRCKLSVSVGGHTYDIASYKTISSSFTNWFNFTPSDFVIQKKVSKKISAS